MKKTILALLALATVQSFAAQVSIEDQMATLNQVFGMASGKNQQAR